MENENFLQKMASQFGQNATVKNVFGEPIQSGNKTIIPVAQIAYGLGGGYGQGGKSKVSTDEEEVKKGGSPMGEGAGGGGGMFAKPKGVYEITPDGTRFIAAGSMKQVLAGLVAGFLLRGFIIRRHKEVRLQK